MVGTIFFFWAFELGTGGFCSKFPKDSLQKTTSDQ